MEPSQELALPDPQQLAAAQVPALVARITDLRELLRDAGDVAGADDLRRRLSAYERYVADKQARRALEAESRRTEVLIGLLLGPAENHGPATFDGVKGSLIDARHRHDFRVLAQYAEVVEECIGENVTARAKILTRIDRSKAPHVDGESAIRHGDFRTVLADIPDGSVDLIFTDPPYAKEYVDLYGELAEFGARVLKPGGSLFAYCGQYALPQIVVDMEASLRYWWMCACVHDGGNHKSLAGVRAYVLWKPIVWFVNGTNASEEFVFDAVLRPAPDKTEHDWQQSLAEPLHYVEKLCPSDGLVVDPFAGGGTTLLAAKQLGRRFIGAEIDLDQQAIAHRRVAA